MLQKIGFGFLTFIGILCIMFGIMALQESNEGEAFLYFMIGIPCAIPLIRELIYMGGDKIKQVEKKNAGDEFYQFLSNSSGANTIVRRCREVKSGESIEITSTSVRIMGSYVEKEMFKLNNPLNKYGTVDELRVFSVWLYNQINLPGYILKPMKGCYTSSLPTGFRENVSGGYSFTYDSYGGDDVYGYEICREVKTANTQQNVTL